ncbi:MAG: right-handed parallel beta-helix repeat-containing protein [candidate division KSB1 bacterium]|nr:right-handed parallel beta-helix repeat-containing protein [candidate division KSB1 bacterium]MDZ7313672.1 right-handed parallel beta-helix repeat-containing protein [candidate division KSB1 bacterium]
MKTKKTHLWLVTAVLLIAFGAVNAQFIVTVTDQTPTAPLPNPAPASYEPRYVSGFGSDGTFTVFFEDRALGNQIFYVATTSGPTGFPATATTTSIIPETHFVIKDWPITINSTTYAYRAWGSVGNNPQHKFYVSNDLTNWTLISTFTIPNAASFTDAHGWVYYGFHDVILLNGTYYAFAESNQSQTMLVRSANGNDVWEAFASIGGRPGWGPLELPSGVTAGWTPRGNFIDLGYDRGYGKIYVDPRDNNFYLAINTAAKASLAPAALEAAFINPANWTWHDGTTGPASNPILSATAEHDLRECWVVPNSNPNADWVIIYDADFGVADGSKALGYATLTPPPPPRVHNLTQGTHYQTIMAAVNAANPGDVIQTDAGIYNERVTINKSLDLRGAQYGVDPTPSGARTNPAAESIIDLSGLPLTNPNVLVEIPNGVTNVSLSGFTLKGSQIFHYADEAVIRCWDDNITIQDNIIDGYYAVLFKGADNLTVHRNRMVVNKVGVTVQPSAANNVTISNNLITRGSSPAADAAGIYLTACSNSNITGNTASGFPGGNGAGGSNLSHVTVSGNTFTGNKDGISFWGNTTFITIANNDLSNAARYGINIKGQDIDITDNTIKNCGDVGINIDRHVIDTKRVRLTCNDIVGNTNFGVKVNTAAVTEIINAELNWWGDASGPKDLAGTTEVPPCADTPVALNANGTGDVVTDNVDYCPWSLSPECVPPAECGNLALLANNMIELDHFGFVEGNIHSNGDIEYDNGRPSRHTGSATAIGNIEVSRDNTITGPGDLTAGGNIEVDEEARVDGTVTPNGTVFNVDLPSLSYSCTGTTSVIAGKDKEKNVAPGDYNLLRADKNAQLNLSAGNYSVKTLQLDDRSRLRVDVSGGDVTINVCVQINFIKNADIIITGGTSRNLTINYLGTKKVVLGKDGGYQGSVVAPNALVELGSKAGFLGSICAKSIAIAKDARVRHHDVAGGIPKATADDNEQSTTSDQQPVTSYQLAQNYPNPFNPNTTIRFALPEAGNVTLAIYNIYGQLVRQLVSGEMKAGWHSVVWDAKNDNGTRVASGVYLYVIKAGSFTAQRKLVLMK